VHRAALCLLILPIFSISLVRPAAPEGNPAASPRPEEVEWLAEAAKVRGPVRDLQAGFTAGATAISANGIIVGSGNSKNGSVRWAFISTGGKAKKTPHFRSTNIEGWGVNDSGVSVGDYYDPNGVQQPFRGKVKLDTLSSVGGQAFDINNAGVAVGSLIGVNPTPAVRWDPGTNTPSVLGLGRPFSINSAGVAAGDVGLLPSPRMWKDGKEIDLPTLGFSSALGSGSVNDINDAEEMAGYVAVAGGHVHAALWKGGKVTDLTPGDPGSSIATAINNHSLVLGIRFGGANFLWDPAHGLLDAACLLDPNSTDSPGWSDLNDRGQIVGEGCVRGKCRRAVVFDMTLIPAGAGSCPAPRLSAITGAVEFEKIAVDDVGLRTDLSPLTTRAAGVSIELIDSGTGATLSSGTTDENGEYRLITAFAGMAHVRAVAGSAQGTVVGVADEILYSVAGPDFTLTPGFDAHQDLVATDASRASGPFNILAALRLAGIWVSAAEPGVSIPPVKVRWSPTNTGGTFFHVATKEAVMKGDRTSDSDEFDDTVIDHEYAHYLEAILSRDDSPGGSHSRGDLLDPRLAWNEGWADFFGVASQDLAATSSLYFDSMSSGVFSFDLEDNAAPAGTPGYWDEHSVSSALWDLYDARIDSGDSGQIPAAQIWQGFRDAKDDTYLYFIDYVDHLVANDSSVEPLLTSLLAERQISYTPGGLPSVTNPFPAPIDAGVPESGTVDSLTRQRDNLLSSSALYGFTLGDAETADAALDITGGPAGMNDLDLVLLDDQGMAIATSSNNGAASEAIHADLQPGFYVLQVKSFSKSGATETFNTGDYTLNLSLAPTSAAPIAAVMAASLRTAKPSAPIRIEVIPGRALAAGRQELQVRGTPLVAGESLTIRVVPQQGLVVASAVPGATVVSPGAADATSSIDLVVARGARGEGRLLVEATLDLGGGNRQSAIALWGTGGPVASIATRPPGSRVVTSTDGRRILEIPSGR